MAKYKSGGKIYKFVLILLLSLVFILMIPESTSRSASPEWCRNITYYLLVLFTFQVIAYRIVLSTSARPLPIVMLVVLYIFNFPKIILHGFNLDQENGSSYVQNMINDIALTDAVNIAIIAIIGMFLGMTLVYALRSKDFETEKSVTIKDYSTAAIVTIFIIGFITDFFYNVVVVLFYGYAGENIEGLPYLNLVRYFTLLLPSSVILSFAKSSFSNTTKRNIFILFVAYKFVCMMGGYRGFALINILLVFFAYYKLCSPFKIKFHHIIIALVVLQLGSGLMVGIRDSRQEGVDLTVVFNAMFDLKNSAILSLLDEFGFSINIVCVVLNQVGENSHQGLLSSFLDIIPGISRITGVGNEGSMDAQLDLRFLGGNVIADMLYGYGRQAMFLVSIIMGIIYAFFFEMFESALEKRNPFVLAYTFPILVEFIFCARSSITKMPREIVWYFLLLLFLTSLFPRKRYVITNPIRK